MDTNLVEIIRQMAEAKSHSPSPSVWLNETVVAAVVLLIGQVALWLKASAADKTRRSNAGKLDEVVETVREVRTVAVAREKSDKADIANLNREVATLNAEAASIATAPAVKDAKP